MSNPLTDSQVSKSGAYQAVSGAHPAVDRNQEGEYVLDTRVSKYEMFSSFLISSIIIIGTMAIMGFLIWMTMWDWGTRSISIPMDEMIGNEDRPEGVADDWQEPGVEEFPEVEVPQLADALEAMTDAVSSVKAQLEKYDGNAAQMGRGKGLGDKRQKGRGNGNSELVPEADRWLIEYSASTMMEYRAQLEFFDIELGALSKTTARIDLISDLTRGTPSRISSNRAQEKRLYFSHTQRRLRSWDQRIAQEAGVADIRQRIIVQFYEEVTRAQLRAAESAFHTKDGKRLLEVQRTFFKVRPKGNGYEFWVDRIEYRKPPQKSA